MRVRHIVSELKIVKSDTQWRSTDMPPKHAPVYAKTKPIRAGWKWRSARAEGDSGVKYILVAECLPHRGNWKCMLIAETAQGPSVIARLEDHASHPGLHTHSHCGRSGIETGASGMDKLARIPSCGTLHRRMNAWTERTFWEAAKRFFRLQEQTGPLI